MDQTPRGTGQFDVDEFIDEAMKTRRPPINVNKDIAWVCPNCGKAWHGKPESDCKGSHLSRAEARGED